MLGMDTDLRARECAGFFVARHLRRDLSVKAQGSAGGQGLSDHCVIYIDTSASRWHQLQRARAEFRRHRHATRSPPRQPTDERRPDQDALRLTSTCSRGWCSSEAAQIQIACVDSDAENIFTTLTVRKLQQRRDRRARQRQDYAKKLMRADARAHDLGKKGGRNRDGAARAAAPGRGMIDVAQEFAWRRSAGRANGCHSAAAWGRCRGGSIHRCPRRRDGTCSPSRRRMSCSRSATWCVAIGTPPTLDHLVEVCSERCRGADWVTSLHGYSLSPLCQAERASHDREQQRLGESGQARGPGPASLGGRRRALG